MWGLNNGGGQTKQLRVCSILTAHQLSVLCCELGIAKRSDRVSHSSSLYPQILEHFIDGAELTL